MKAIISRYCPFETEQDVQAYLDGTPDRDGLYLETSPSDTVTEYKVGYKLIVLKFMDGHVETFNRRDVEGFAVDSQAEPIVIHGPNFKRINVEVTPDSLDRLQDAVNREYQDALDRAKKVYDAACDAVKARYDERTASIKAERDELDRVEAEALNRGEDMTAQGERAADEIYCGTFDAE